MLSKKPTEGKRKHKEDNFDSFSYQCLDDLICSDKKDAAAVDNIEDLVDSTLAKNKVSSYDERVKNNYFVDSTDRLWRHGGIRKVLGIVNKPLVRKVLSILLSFLLIFVQFSWLLSFRIHGLCSPKSMTRYQRKIINFSSQQ